MNTQFETSITVRPQPRQMSSNKVEQTATQGESGKDASRPGVRVASSSPDGGDAGDREDEREWAKT